MDKVIEHSLARAYGLPFDDAHFANTATGVATPRFVTVASADLRPATDMRISSLELQVDELRLQTERLQSMLLTLLREDG